MPIWVWFPRLPLHCWNPESLEAIGNTLGRYIDKAKRQDQYTNTRICVEVDLEIGLLEAINITVADWCHIQELDYKQLSFKCRYCHEHDHLLNIAKKKEEETPKNSKGE